MPQIAAVTLNDGATSPVSHVFSPVSIDSTGVAKWADRSSGTAIGFPVISISMRAPNKGSRNYRVTGKVSVPTLEAVSASTATGITPAPVKAYDLLGTFEFVLPERSTLQNRKDLVAYITGFLSHSAVQAMVTDLETIY